MKSLPKRLNFQKRTPDFNHETVPAGILGQHKTASDTWGKIVVTEGSLTYRILEPNVEEHIISTENYGVIAPQLTHQVEMHESVKFHIEFYKDAV